MMICVAAFANGGMGRHLAELSFQEVLAPYEGALFLREVLGQSALYLGGDPSKFGGLFSWDVLNHLMEFGGLSFPRLRLIDGGRELPSDSYLRTGLSGYPRPLVHEINSALREGATLAIESVEELHEPVSQLCKILEERLEVPVQVDLYASWRDKVEQELRWNEHEVLVLQLEGSKSWKVHGATAAHPTSECFPPAPMGEATWEGTLGAGGLLYIPRGWWYCETTVEAALYLGVKFRRPTGVDVLQRLFEQLTKSTEMRVDCPRFAGPESQSAFIKSVQREVAKACTSAGLLVGFLGDWKALTEPRVGFSFPWGASDPPQRPSDDCLLRPLLRFPGPDSVRHAIDDDCVEVAICGKIVRFDENTGKILEHICTSPCTTVREVTSAFAPEMLAERILAALVDLTQHGIVALREPGLSRGLTERRA